MTRSVLVVAFAASAAIGVAGATEGNWKNFSDPYSSARGNCPDCRPGEAMAVAEAGVNHGVYVDTDNPPCGDAKMRTIQIPQELKTAASGAFYAQGLGPAGSFALGFSDTIINGLVQAGVNDAGTVGQLMRGWTNQPQVANCTRLLVTLPKTVHITRIVPTMNCPAGGWCGFASAPSTDEIDGNLFAVNVVAKNWSHNQNASGRLQVFYTR
jgi:hypothetical protein